MGLGSFDIPSGDVLHILRCVFSDWENVRTVFICEYKDLEQLDKLQKRPHRKQKYSTNLSATRPQRRQWRRQWRAVAPALLNALDREQSPSEREVVDRRPKGPTPEGAVVVESSRHIFLHEVFNCCRFRHRATETGKGKSSPAAPQNRQPDGGSRSTPGLLGAPPSRGRTATCKTNPAAPLPPRRRRLDTLSKPTLYTRRESGFPRPPAAGAAGGG
jgi:hypothetical protein